MEKLTKTTYNLQKLTMENWQEVVYDILNAMNGTIFNDPEWLVTQISAACNYSTFIISETIGDKPVVITNRPPIPSDWYNIKMA